MKLTPSSQKHSPPLPSRKPYGKAAHVQSLEHGQVSQQVAEGYVGSSLETKGESLSALIVTCPLQCVSRNT